MKNVKVDELAAAIVEELQQYSDEVTAKVKDTIDKVSEDCNEEIKKHITFKERTGKYVKNFAIKKGAYEDKYNKRNTWYVKNPNYRLTHLLENGHAKVNGGRTQAYPHIKYGEEIAKRELPEKIKEAIENND